MLFDGSHAFTWNARDQLAGLNGTSLQYDGAGRRIKNLLGTSLLYSGDNVVQELSGTNATANRLTGAIDEAFLRSDASGSFTPLLDVLGSTIALVDVNGTLQTSYSYDPFGNTTTSGVANDNPAQYTGRENDGNGLYFYRARYYSPQLARFVSEDPLGIAGSGPNLYSYVGDSPTNFRDPTGLRRDCPVPRLCGDPPGVAVGPTRPPDDDALAGSFTGPGVQAGSSITVDMYGRIYVTPLALGA